MTARWPPQGPVVDLVACGPAPEPLARLLRVLARWCRVRASDPWLTDVEARVALAGRPSQLRRAFAEPAVPVALWVDGAPDSIDVIERALPVASRARVLLVDDSADARALGQRALPVSRHATYLAAHPPIAPLVRSRWRRRLGLPDDFTVRIGVPEPSRLTEAAIPAALAVAAGAVVRGPWLPVALALGTPVVTDAASIEVFGVGSDGACMLAEPGGFDLELTRLISDDERAAAASWAARRFAERHLDLGCTVQELMRRLGISRFAAADAWRPSARLAEALDELHTPLVGPIGRRAFAAGTPLTGSPR
ncbi:MAG: hypothetical protein FJW88_01125 [Actinobacteria bacterium]|nr:hypothetical protein [Actinomycetota bacterium]